MTKGPEPGDCPQQGALACARGTDLEAALTQAAIDVKANQIRTGAMPDKLPNAALIAKVGKETKVKRI